MHFVLPIPSLQHLAEVKIVAHLWSQRDSLTQIRRSGNGLPGYQVRQNPEKWKQVEDTLRNKVSLLPIPEPSKKPLLNIIKPLGSEIIEWSDYLNSQTIEFPALDVVKPHQLCWTMRGTIDHKKTAALLVKDERVDVIGRRYELACINCLEEEARQLFQSMSEEQRRVYVYYEAPQNRHAFPFAPHISLGGNRRKAHDEDLINYFTWTLRGNARDLNNYFKGRLKPGETIRKKLFDQTLSRGNRATCEYLFTKLQQREKEQFIVKCVEDVYILTRSPSVDLLYFLSLMNDEQQRRLFRESARVVLESLLNWPLQSLFVEAAECGWQLMEKVKCEEVLNNIVVRIGFGYKEYDYPQLFWECWRLSSTEYKQHFLNSYRFLVRLLQTKRAEFIQLIYNQAPAQVLRELVRERFDEISRVLTDESVISDAGLMECKQTAKLDSKNDKRNKEKRLWSKLLSQLVDTVMAKRRNNREIA